MVQQQTPRPAPTITYIISGTSCNCKPTTATLGVDRSESDRDVCLFAALNMLQPSCLEPSCSDRDDPHVSCPLSSHLPSSPSSTSLLYRRLPQLPRANKKDAPGGDHHHMDVVPPSSHPKKQRSVSSPEPTSVVRRPRGRPPGSKNKPKAPVFVTRDDPDSNGVIRPHVLQVSAGQDVGDALAAFSRRRDVGLSVLAGTGLVSNVTLHQPSFCASSAGSSSGGSTSTSTSTFTFHGRFQILSISATFLPPSYSASSPLIPAIGGLTVSLAGPQGQIVGGAVAGRLVAAGTVTMVVAAFWNPTFHRLPLEEEITVSGGSSRHDQQQQIRHGRGVATHGHDEAASGGTAMGMASCYLPSDVMWAPHPPPPY